MKPVLRRVFILIDNYSSSVWSLKNFLNLRLGTRVTRNTNMKSGEILVKNENNYVSVWTIYSMTKP